MSASLPREETKSESAEKGTAVHDFLDKISMGVEYDSALATVPREFMADCLSVEVGEIPTLTELQTEVAIAWNPWSGKSRILGHHLGRDYAGADRTKEYVGTADRIGRMVGGEYDGWFVVDDYKTGSARTVDRVEKNWQTLTLAIAFAAEFNLDRVLVGIIKTQGTVRPYYFPLEKFDLAIGADALKQLADTIQSGAAKMVQGEHCRWCDSFIYCPKKKELAIMLAKKPELTIEAIADAIQTNPAGAYERWRTIKQVVHKLDGIMRAHAEKSPISLSEGRVYGPVSVTKNEIDPRVAFKALLDKFDMETAQMGMSLEASKASIERAVATQAPRGKKASMVREMLQEIAGRGGIRLKEKTEVREHVPGEAVDAD